MAEVAVERPRVIVDATGLRIGGVRGAVDSVTGLAVTGATGRVLAWVRLDPDGRLIDLRISGTPVGRRRLPAGVVQRFARAFWFLFFGWQIFASWTAAFARKLPTARGHVG